MPIKQKLSRALPRAVRPLLQGLKWNSLDINKDKEDIIFNIVNEGTLTQWKWLIATYGKSQIRRTLQKRLESELFPESRRLAALVFAIKKFRHARRSTH